jgi:chaperone modulatory protein CbpM
MTPYAIVHQTRPAGLPVEQFAAASGLHPQLVARLVALGLLDGHTDATGAVVLPAAQITRAARIIRLRTGLGLNYTAVGVVLDLLDRIEELEAALRARPNGYWR